MAGKDLVETAADEPPRPPPPAEPSDGRMDNPRILGDRQVRAERQLLVDRTQPERLRPRGGINAQLFAADHEAAMVGRDGPVQDMHQGRLASAVVADDPDAFARRDRKIDAVQSPDGAIGFFDAGEVDEKAAVARHGLSFPERATPFVSPDEPTSCSP